MKKVIWIVLGLFLIGNALFVLPVHYTSDNISSDYFINYKKDSVLLHAVFPDSGVSLTLNMPPAFDTFYKEGMIKMPVPKQQLFVNASLLHNVGFASLLFPFYKTTTFTGSIGFYSNIRVSNQPLRDSIVLIGNIQVRGHIAVAGICTPLYVRALADKELAAILKKEMKKIQEDINRPPAADSVIVAPVH